MIELLYSGNAKMLQGIMISVVSAAENTRRPLSVTLLTMDLRDEDPAFAPLTAEQAKAIEMAAGRKNPDVAVRVLDCAALYRERIAATSNAATSYSPYCFLRLFADRLPLPDQVLYLDADTVIAGDLGELWDTDVSKKEFAAVLDYYGKIFMGIGYFNSGVLLLNLDMIRNTGLFGRAIGKLEKRRLFLPDQTALYMTARKIKYLPRRFNEQKKYDRRDTVVQHFTKTIIWLPRFHTRTIKPWQPELVSEVLTSRYDGIIAECLEEVKRFETAGPVRGDERSEKQ